MIKRILTEFENIDKKVIKYINIGFILSFNICILGCACILVYNKIGTSYDIYTSGIILIRTGITFIAQCFCCGFISDKIMKEMI